MLSDEAFLYLTIILSIFAFFYWAGLLIYIFYDDLVELLTSNTKSVTIVKDEPIYTPQVAKLRNPVK